VTSLLHDAIVTSVPPSWRTYGWSVILTSAAAPSASVAAAEQPTASAKMSLFM
jgi:hypothetical protein